MNETENCQQYYVNTKPYFNKKYTLMSVGEQIVYYTFTQNPNNL